MPVQCTCAQCGKTMLRKPSDVRAHTYCSRACQNAAQVIRTERPCLTCGANFAPYLAEIRKGGGKFCSRPCYVASITIPLDVRYWAKVNKHGPIIRPELGPCWEWTGARNPNGYGVISDHRTPSGKARATHIALEFDGRPLPEDLEACHSCDWPPCVNTAHLWHGTQSANLRDMVSKDRHAAVTKPEKVLRGTQIGTSKLNDAIVLDIRRRFHAGEATIKELAAEHDVWPSTVQVIVTGKRWKHLPLHPR